jgi:hypothetical protein
MSVPSEFLGQCLCGTVRFAARPPTLFCAHCHCRFCRRAHGAAFVTWFGVPENQFKLLSGQGALTWYASSQQSRRGFCSQCGSTMFFTSRVAPGEVHIARAYVDGSIDRDPESHVFVDHQVEWFSINDDLRQLDSNSEALAHYKSIKG